MTTGVLIGVCASVVIWFSSNNHRSEFFLDIEPEQLYVFVGAQGNLSAEEEYAIVKRAEDLIFHVPGIESISTRSGAGSQSRSFGEGGSDIPVDTIGRILVDLDGDEIGKDGREIEADIKERLRDFIGGNIEIQRREQGPPTGKDIQISLKSNNQVALFDTARRIREHLDGLDSLVDVEDTRPLPGTEWRIEVDREMAARFGADVTQVGTAIQLITNGVLVGRFRPDDANDEVDIRVRLPQSERSVEALDTLRLATPAGPVPISAFVDRIPAPRVDKIDRRNGKRLVTLRANTAVQGEGAQRTAEVAEWIKQQNFDPQVDVAFEGANEDTAEAGAFFVAAAFGTLFMMAVILLWEFNNFYHVALTLSSVILSTIGVLLGIQIAMPYISILMTGTGVVALAGIVVNNNIVLIDTFQRLRKTTNSAREAAIATAAQRMRPIFLTTFTTICGLLPMIFQINVSFLQGQIGQGGAGSEWWVQLSNTVVFGLGFSTMVTLLVTPVWLAVPEKIAGARDRMLERVFGHKQDDNVQAQNTPMLEPVKSPPMEAAE